MTSTGTVLAWGDNVYGQLGNGTNTDSNVPVPVSLPAGTTITAIAAGDVHSLALTSTGTVLAWGFNNFGQLGNGTNTDSNVPVAGELAGRHHDHRRRRRRRPQSGVDLHRHRAGLGCNCDGQLGNGTNTNSNVPVPVSLPAGTTITAIAAGGDHSLALTSTGTVLAWGINASGQLGNGTNTNSNVPVAVNLPAGTTITAIAAGDHPQSGVDLHRHRAGLGCQRLRPVGERDQHRQQRARPGEPAGRHHDHRHRRRGGSTVSLSRPGTRHQPPPCRCLHRTRNPINPSPSPPP